MNKRFAFPISKMSGFAYSDGGINNLDAVEVTENNAALVNLQAVRNDKVIGHSGFGWLDAENWVELCKGWLELKGFHVSRHLEIPEVEKNTRERELARRFAKAMSLLGDLRLAATSGDNPGLLNEIESLAGALKGDDR